MPLPQPIIALLEEPTQLAQLLDEQLKISAATKLKWSLPILVSKRPRSKR